MSAASSVRLFTADLHYDGGMVLHTASSGAVPALAALYLLIEHPDGAWGLGEVRTNVSYLNGLSDAAVRAGAIAAVGEIDWRRTPEELLAALPQLDAGWTAPVRTLIDIALHDLVARRAGMGVSVWLGGTAAVQHATNQTLFWSSFETFLARALAYVARGFVDLKIRVAAGDFAEDLRRIDALRDRFGSRITIAIDANGCWTEAEAIAHLQQLVPYDLAYAEQPIAPGDWSAIERVAQSVPTPIMLDESVANAADIDRIIACGGRVAAHLKLIKLGGIGPLVAAARRLERAGVPFMIGQMNEGAGATAAALHATLATAPCYAELYGADGLLDDPVAGLTYRDGAVAHGDGPGLGIRFDPMKTTPLLEITR